MNEMVTLRYVQRHPSYMGKNGGYNVFELHENEEKAMFSLFLGDVWDAYGKEKIYVDGKKKDISSLRKQWKEKYGWIDQDFCQNKPKQWEMNNIAWIEDVNTVPWGKPLFSMYWNCECGHEMRIFEEDDVTLDFVQYSENGKLEKVCCEKCRKNLLTV